MKLIGIPLSPFVRKVAVILNLKELDYSIEPIMPGDQSPDFLALSPLGKIPVLQDGDFAVADSSVICEYLEEEFPECPVMPQGTEARARARFLEEYGDNRLIEIAAIFFIENFFKPRLRGLESNQARIQEAKNELLPPLLDYLESQVPPEGYLFGNFTTADISIVTPIFQAAYGDYELDSARWPRFAAFVQRVAEHPAVIQAREMERQTLASMGS